MQVALGNLIVSQIRLKQLIVSSHAPSPKSPSPTPLHLIIPPSRNSPSGVLVILIIIMKHKAYISVTQLTDDTTTDKVPETFI
jgi:hypothetical protein